MTTQFRMLDNAKLDPSRVHIQWSMRTEHDDTKGRPDEDDEGFWPSSDPDACGYVEPSRFDEAMRKAQERMDAFDRGDWHFCGVVARAEILIPIGGNSFRSLMIESAGLWGIESDSGDYLREVYEEEKDELRAQLRMFADCILSDKTSETDK